MISSRGVSGAASSATATCVSLAAAQDAELGAAAERLGGEAVVEGVGVVDRLAVDGDDQVAGLQAARAAGLVGVTLGDQRAGRALEAEALGDLRRHRLQLAPSQGRLTALPPLLR